MRIRVLARTVSTVLLAVLAVGSCPSAEARADWTAILGNKSAALVVLDGRTGHETRVHPDRCSRRLPPFSTFKVPNAIIALETNVIPDERSAMAWDPERYPRQEWWPVRWPERHDLQSALKYSVVWYFQEIARGVGLEVYRRYLDRFDYGNREVGNQVTTFWLGGPLEISADEQVAFLRKFHAGGLASARTTEIVKRIMVLEEKDGARFSGKTGTGRLPSGRWAGWMVGYVERGETVSFFALNLEADEFETLRKRREKIVRLIVDELSR